MVSRWCTAVVREELGFSENFSNEIRHHQILRADGFVP
jgi:hypothetical protein